MEIYLNIFTNVNTWLLPVIDICENIIDSSEFRNLSPLKLFFLLIFQV